MLARGVAQDRILPLFSLLQCGGGGFCLRGEETKVPSQGTKAKARARTRTQQSTGFFVCPFSVLYFQGSSCQHQQFQHSLTAAIWTLIRQQLPATTLKMRLLSLLLSAHRLILMTMTIPKYRPASAGKFYRCNTEMIYRNTDRPVPVIYRYRPGGG